MILEKMINLNKESKNIIEKHIQVVGTKNEELKKMILLDSRNIMLHRQDVKATTLTIDYNEKYGVQKIENLVNGLTFKRAPFKIILNHGNKMHEIKMQLFEVIQVKNTKIYRYITI